MYGQIIEPPPGITSATLGGETLTDLVLSPSSSVINFDDLKIYRIGAGKRGFIASKASDLQLLSRALSEMQPVPVDPSQPGSGLLNAMLALLMPPNSDERDRYDEEILDLSVSGFIIM
jgi:polyribonucleotide 5'-hydroxyl-kinase